jgi:hypothetical protein
MFRILHSSCSAKVVALPHPTSIPSTKKARVLSSIAFLPSMAHPKEFQHLALMVLHHDSFPLPTTMVVPPINLLVLLVKFVARLAIKPLIASIE